MGLRYNPETGEFEGCESGETGNKRPTSSSSSSSTGSYRPSGSQSSSESDDDGCGCWLAIILCTIFCFMLFDTFDALIKIVHIVHGMINGWF